MVRVESLADCIKSQYHGFRPALPRTLCPRYGVLELTFSYKVVAVASTASIARKGVYYDNLSY